MWTQNTFKFIIKAENISDMYCPVFPHKIELKFENKGWANSSMF